ncbi:MAG: Ig-like domain repeat protein [Acidobacteriota bacterium]
MRSACVCAVLLGAILVCGSASAATLTWTGANGPNWSNPANWSPATTPAEGDELVFPVSPSQPTMTNDLPAGFEAGPLQFFAEYTLGGNAITLTGDVYFHPYVVAVTFNADLIIGADLQLGNFEGAAVVNGTLDVAGHTLAIGTTRAIFWGTIGGTGVITGERYIFIVAGGSFTGEVRRGPSGYTVHVHLTGPMPGLTLSTTSLDQIWLSGDGGVAGYVSATLTPGSWFQASAGTLDTGPLAVRYYIADVYPGGVSDLVRAHGNVSVGGPLSLAAPAGVPALGEVFTLIDNDGTDAVAGTFSGLGEGATTSAGGAAFRVSYRGGDGNDVTLTRINPPRTWTGALDANWSNPNNWSPAGVPAAGDVLTFPADASHTDMENDLAPGFSVGRMSFFGGYGLGGNPLTLLGDVVFEGSSGSTSTFNADLTLGGPVTIRMPNAVINGGVDVNGQTLTLEAAATLTGPILGTGAIVMKSNTVTVTGSGTFSGSIGVLPSYTSPRLEMEGSLPDASFTGGILTGTGTLGPVTINQYGFISPGQSLSYVANAGVLHAKSLTIGGTYPVDLYPAATSDVIQVAGSVSLSGTLQIRLNGGSPATGQSFTIIDNDGADGVNGTFSGLPEGALIDLPPVRFRISYAGGDGNDVTLTATAGAQSTTTLTVDPPQIVLGETAPLTLVATVSSPAGVPTGTVTFYVNFWAGEGIGTNKLGTAPLQNGVARFPRGNYTPGYSDLPQCTYYATSYRADYDGSETIIASSSATARPNVVGVPTKTTITSSKSPSAPGEAVTFTATVSVLPPSTAPLQGYVYFEIDGVNVSGALALNAGKATFTTSTLTEGSHTVSAEFLSYFCYTGLAASEEAMTQVVGKKPTTVSVHSSRNPSAPGEDVTLTVNVSAGTTPADGIVTVTENGNTIAQQNLVAGAANIVLIGLGVGEHHLLVSYPGNGQFDPGSRTFMQIVLPAALAMADAVIEEGSSNKTIAIPVHLSAPVSQTVTVSYSTLDGGAKAGEDYLAAQGTLSFLPGETAKTIPITIVGDNAPEDDESFSVTLTQPDGAPVDRATATVIILNDDASFTASSFTYAQNLTLDVYTPATAGPFPVILWVPGTSTYAPGGVSPALRQTRRGYVVVVPSYRTPSQAIFPAQLDDLKAAIRWIRANAATLRIDGQHVAIWGSGTGAHLASLVGTASDASSRVQAVIDWGGASDLLTLDADSTLTCVGSHSGGGSPESALIGCALQSCPSAASAASPLSFVSADDPSFLIVHGAADCVIPAEQSRKFYAALRAAGVPATLHIINGIGANDAWWYSAAANDQVDAFLDARLHTAPPRRRATRH